MSSGNRFFVVICIGGNWQIVDEKPMYVRKVIKNRVLNFDPKISFIDFYKMVKRKTMVGDETDITLSFQHPERLYVADIGDDDDFCHLMSVLEDLGKTTLYVYVVEGDSKWRVNEEGNYIGPNLTQYDIVPTKVKIPEQSAKKDMDIMQADYCQPHNKYNNPIFESEYFNYAGYSDGATYFDDVGRHDDTSYGPEFPLHSDHDLTPHHLDCHLHDSLIYACDNDEDDHLNSDYAYSDDDDTSKLNNYLLLGMPPTPPCPGPIAANIHSHSKHAGEKIKKDQTFRDKEALKLALGKKALQERFEFKTSRSCKQRYEVVCVQENCSWFVKAVLLKHTRGLFQIRKIDDVHTCSHTQLNSNHRQANKKVMGHLLSEILSANHGRVYRGSDIIRDFNSKYGVDITYKQAWRGKEEALSILRGTLEESFTKLPVYFYNLEKHNPGTVTCIKTDDDDRFLFLFVAFGCSVKGFINHCRPTIVVDGAHLKGEFKGTMLIAVAMDGHNQILPIAYGICKSECTEYWTWFLQKLRDCIGDFPDITFISDRHQSIAAAIRNVFPHAHHGICAHHLYANVTARFGRDKKTKSLFWEACRAYTILAFDDAMDRLKSARPKVWEFVLHADPQRWARAHFSGNRYNLMTSNSAESINSLARHARRMPVLMLIDFFRATMQDWYYKRRNFAATVTTTLTGYADDRVKKSKEESSNWTVHPITNNRYQVNDFGHDGVVDLNRGTCTCRKWQLSGLPCGHAIRVVTILNHRDCGTLAIKAYHANTLRSTYANCVNPLPPPCDWEYPDGLMIVKPPLMDKRQPGRPRNKDRIPSQGEDPIVKECSRCGQKGHTRFSCSSYQSNNKPEGSSSNKNNCKKGAPKCKANFGSDSQYENVYYTVDLNSF